MPTPSRHSRLLVVSLLLAMPLAGLAATFDLAGTARATPYPTMGALELSSAATGQAPTAPAAVAGLTLTVSVN